MITSLIFFFFFNDTATTDIYPLSLHDALPIFDRPPLDQPRPHVDDQRPGADAEQRQRDRQESEVVEEHRREQRSEEHTSELQSRQYLVCRLLLEKTKHTATTRCHVTRRR